MLLETVIFSVDVPEFVIELEVKLVVSPLGADADSETVPVKPLRAFTVTVEVPEDPLLMVKEFGEAEIEKSGAVTCTFTVTLCTSDPLVPVTVTGNVPAACPAGTIIVSVEVPGPVTEGGLGVAVHPVGALTVRATVLVNPFSAFIVNVVVPCCLFAVFIVTGLGEAEIAKSSVVTAVKVVVRGLPKPVARS
jgi:hypothetical protein